MGDSESKMVADGGSRPSMAKDADFSFDFRSTGLPTTEQQTGSKQKSFLDKDSHHFLTEPS